MRSSGSLADSGSGPYRVSSGVTHVSIFILLPEANVDVLGVLGGVHRVPWKLHGLLLLLLVHLLMLIILLLLQVCENSGAIIRLHLIIVCRIASLKTLLCSAILSIRQKGIVLPLALLITHVHFCGKMIFVFLYRIIIIFEF